MSESVRMSDTELASSFRRAHNKKVQVCILADLNLCSPYEIAARLDALGKLAAEGLTPAQFSSRYKPLPKIDREV